MKSYVAFAALTLAFLLATCSTSFAADWTIGSIGAPSGAKGFPLTATSCAGTECTAVGSYVNASGTLVTQAQRRNGSTAPWSVQT
ncbi:MAG TPA: hypothetical protein VFR75_03330, partial [Solirubrobacterales bacterium]|nr:hypothetical protein [Solirubrobacterales bacterium]